ncbi:MAG: hypothetical protein PF694_00465 [Bacteroidetes bacterium]|jgi:hypothetical protein|nr:hypothetical protein [Bacteroidota bacterium]
MKLLSSLILTFLILPLCLTAQYYLSGEDPSSLRWKQINTTWFRVIYPEEAGTQAQKLAQILDQVYAASRLDLASPALRSDLILHNQAVISNATVAWAPRRLDFFSQPPQNGYAQNWFSQLAVHELRHIAQISKFNDGLGRLLNIGFGQQASAALLGAFIPLWFTEGDAVTNETMLSYSGRGREGIFLSKLRTQLLQKGYYVYDKAYFGSYKDYTPNIYELGYYLVAHNKNKYGSLLWENTLRQTARNPWTLAPFSLGIKQITGHGKIKLYQETMFDLFENWKTAFDTTQYTAVDQFSPVNKAFTNYRFPQRLSNGGVIALRTAINDINRLVLIDQGKEKILYTPGAIFQHSLSATDSLLVWNELQPDLRWPNRNFAVLKIAEIHQDKICQLTHKSRYFAPDISSDNKRIVCINSSTKGSNFLTLLDAKTGEVLFESELKDLFPATPKWHPDNERIVVTMTGSQGKALYLFDVQMKSWQQLSSFTFTDIQLSDVTSEQVIFSASQSEISQIYALDLQSKTIEKLVSVPFGATDAIMGDEPKTLIFSDYTADGFRLVAVNESDFLNQYIDPKLPATFPLAEELSLMRSLIVDTIVDSDTVYPENNYAKLAHLFQFHSWSPVFVDVDNISFQPGISLFSQNSLSTMVVEAGYSYDVNEQTGKTTVGLQYRGWYPVIDLNFSRGLRRGQAQDPENGKPVDLKWDETAYKLGLSLPLNFTRDKYLRGVQPYIGWEQLHRKMDPAIELAFKDNDFSLLNLQLFAYNQLRQSKRDLYPRWGQQFRLIFQRSLFDDQLNEQSVATVNFYFPGIFPHHSIRLYGGYQSRSFSSYSFGNPMRYPRGYTNLFPKIAHVAMLDYTYPLFYPDLNVPGIFFLQRLRMGIFADYMNYVHKNNIDLSSAGIELYSDWHFFNLPAPVILGVRLSQAFYTDKLSAELLFGINIASLY